MRFDFCLYFCFDKALSYVLYYIMGRGKHMRNYDDDTSLDLISLTLAENDILNESDCSDIYREEQILKKTSQYFGNATPEIIKMKQIAARITNRDRCFYEQGKFMENYEDNFRFSRPCNKYFPTYRDMSVSELRGYFTWRTAVRRGQMLPAPVSFIFMYIYELINQIGVSSPEDGFSKLIDIWENYKTEAPRITWYMSNWLIDYVVYYNLDKSLVKDIYSGKSDEALGILVNRRSKTDSEVFSALSSLSSYNIEKSRFYKEYPDDFAAVAVSVFDKMNAYFEKRHTYNLTTRLFGKNTVSAHYMFISAVFLDRMPNRSCDYVFNDMLKFHCRSGRWTCEHRSESKEHSTALGDLIRSVDCALRKAYGCKYTLKAKNYSPIAEKIIAESITELLEKKKKKNRRKVEIDVSALSSIRASAEKTCESLLTEEERFEEPKTAPETESPALLTDAEKEFLKLLLKGSDTSLFLKERNLISSVVCDSVNEKLFDTFSDTVIEFDGDTPIIIEDYKEELEKII